jgi:HAD superfamily hydrolase (TIGR01549 family)
MKIKGIIYDWDGVFVNSSKAFSLGRLERVLKRNGYELDAEAHKRVDAYWGRRGNVFMAHVLGVDEEVGARLYHEWEMLDVTDPYPFIPNAVETVSDLHMLGVKSAILTSRSSDSLTAWTSRTPVFKEFISITCQDDSAFHKPDPRALDRALAAFATHGIHKDACIFVGDTKQDILAARGAGVRPVVVETGPYRESHSRDAPVDECDVIPSLGYLREWMDVHGM